LDPGTLAGWPRNRRELSAGARDAIDSGVDAGGEGG
jgi:hypothetical protein